MAEATIPVDLLNPGQVFACLGFLEAADILLGDARGGFDWSDENNVQFRLEATSDESPVETVLSFLSEAKVTSRSATSLGIDTKKWDIETTQYSDDTPFPFPPPDKPAKLTAVLSGDSDRFEGSAIEIFHWGDDRVISGRDNVKFWAGSGGKAGAAFLEEYLSLTRDKIGSHADDPFALRDVMSSSFRFDWRRDYVPIDVGFSLNHHKGRITTVGYPLVEVLAAIGLTHARPEFHSKLLYRYGALGVGSDGDLFEPFFLRASLGAPNLPFSQRTFWMNLGWPGKEGQARCITDVYEELSNE